MHLPPDIFAQQVSAFLGPFYLALALMNAVAAYYLWQGVGPSTWFNVPLGKAKVPVTNAVVWTIVAAAFVIVAAFAMSGNAPTLPMWLREWVNSNTGPVIYTVGTTAVLVVLYLFRSFFVQPVVAWTIWNLMFLFLGLSMPDQNFYAIVAKPDNVPIVALVFLLAFFTWLAAYRAVLNDQRIEKGEPPLEALDNEKVLVWPDLVYTEMICMIALTAVLIFWGIALQAPLEDMASSVKTPNPSKAPWYFLGLQEMLVYFDPWMAGVVLPSLIIVGLMAIPYLDFNKSGNGYYTINQRKFSYITFQLGFLELWVTLIVLGTLLRGPNWEFFGPYEYWDTHKVSALDNVNLSQWFWNDLLGRTMPSASIDASKGVQAFWIIIRELPGIALVLFYFVALPPIMGVTVFRNFYPKMGLIRYMTMAMLLLFMASLPIKMVLRWVFNLKYLIAIPEYFLNF